MIRTLLATTAILALGAASARAETVAITHAHVLTMGKAGDLTDATVVIRDGVIASVGQGAAPAGARVIDGTGTIVTPGLI
ncbi:MAG: amidohydrolase family protein, partial [Caulobacteraceae bacterium]